MEASSRVIERVVTPRGELVLREARDGVELKHVDADHPYEGIIDTAKMTECDLIVMASHGRKGAAALLLGTETVKVLTHSKIPVLVCR